MAEGPLRTYTIRTEHNQWIRKLGTAPDGKSIQIVWDENENEKRSATVKIKCDETRIISTTLRGHSATISVEYVPRQFSDIKLTLNEMIT